MDAITQANIRDYLSLARDDLDATRQLLSTGRYRQAVSRATMSVICRAHQERRPTVRANNPDYAVT